MALKDDHIEALTEIQSQCDVIDPAAGSELDLGEKKEIDNIRLACLKLKAGLIQDLSNAPAPGAKGYARFFNGALVFVAALMASLFVGLPHAERAMMADVLWRFDSNFSDVQGIAADIVYEEILGRLALIAVIAATGACINQLNYTKPTSAWRKYCLLPCALGVLVIGAWASFPLLQTIFIGHP